MLSPKLDERDRAKILKELEVLASQYAPELKDRNDAGFAVLQVFAFMIDDVITRLNKVPEKNFLVFLNMLGTEPDNDIEKVDSVPEKVPKRFQHNWRAVAHEDYEWLAKEASTAVARAKCIPNFSGAGEEKSGCVSVIIVPEGVEDKPNPSPELLRMVEQYLKSRSPVSVSSLTVTSPIYLEISVTADLYVTSMDSASIVKFKAMEQLKNFLHPLHGGYKSTGWDFGGTPCNLDISALLQKIPEVDHVENLSITVKEEKSGKSFALKHDICLPAHTLIFSGSHQIQIRCIEVS